MKEARLRQIANTLIAWFDLKGRTFPWRFKEDRYLVLATEFLLQRTKASVAKNAYEGFFHKYDTLAKLADSKEKTLADFFIPLGLNYRGPRLVGLARELEKNQAGQIPCDMDSLLRLRGVGVYIASAVMNFACGTPTPVIDKNVLRVLNRHFGIVRESDGRKLISALYRFGDCRKLAYALIDLGAIVCLANQCSCPLRDILPNFPLKKKQWRMLRKVIDGRGNVVLREQTVES
jgi:A/G-specific adenine glycosylase